jgi:hypothetical protein
MRTAPLALLLCGCISTSQMATNQVSHQPVAYQQGFKDGCDSGYAAAGHVYYRPAKNLSRWEADKLYTLGHNDGFAQCKGSYESIGRAVQR